MISTTATNIIRPNNQRETMQETWVQGGGRIGKKAP